MPVERPATRPSPAREVLLALLASVACLLVLLLLQDVGDPGAWAAVRLVAALAGAWAIPGWLLVDACLPARGRTDAIERAVLVAAGGGAVAILDAWWGSAVFGHLSPARVAAIFWLTTLALGAVAWRRGASGRPRGAGRSAWLALAVVVLFGAALRLPNLGYSELQGDEAIVLAKAAALVDGRRDAYLVHKKGPAEILIAAQVYALGGGAANGGGRTIGGRLERGRVSERAARLPFALTMLVGLAALFALGRAMFGWRVALAAGLLLGVNGFFVAFARVVQYQSVVFALSTAAMLCAFRLSGPRDGLDGDDDPQDVGDPGLALDRDDGGHPVPRAQRFGEPGWWLLAALLLAVGILAHYDAALAGPAILLLAVRRWRNVPGSWRADRWAVAAGVALGAVLLAAFFVPLVNHPYFRQTTLPYLLDVRLGGGESTGWWLRLPENLRRSTALATFYSPVWYGLALVLLAAVELARRARARRAPGAAWWAVLVWWLVPLGFYFVLVESPRTHFHVAFPAWTLLAALGSAWLWQRTGGDAENVVGDATSRGKRGAGLGGIAAALVGAAFLGGCTWYIWYAFLQHDVEYRRAYPDARPAGFPLPVTDLPSSGWFGFPYRAGWKAIGALYADGTLRGDYDSNEEPAVTAWYTRGAPRCPDRPRYAFVAEQVQDVQPLLGDGPDDVLARDYVRIGGVTSGGRERIALYERRDLNDPAAPPIAVAVEDVADQFDRLLSGPRFDAGLADDDPTRWIANDLDARFGEQARLVGWALVGADPADSGARSVLPEGAPGASADPTFTVRPGARLILTLVWRADGPIDRDWSVFAHVEREGEATVGQSDGAPLPPKETVCASDGAPMSGWLSGAVIQDRRVIAIDPSAAPGDYDLLVGLYDYSTLDRLRVVDDAGAATTDRVRLAGIEVAAP